MILATDSAGKSGGETTVSLPCGAPAVTVGLKVRASGALRPKYTGGKRKTQKTSNSFEFTSFWADAGNKAIEDLVDFTKTFFAKHALLNVLTKYCVLTSDDLLLVMRPYQIVATERIINRIEVSTNYKRLGSALRMV